MKDFDKKETEFLLGLLEYRILTLEFWAKKKMRGELKMVKKLRSRFESLRNKFKTSL